MYVYIIISNLLTTPYLIIFPTISGPVCPEFSVLAKNFDFDASLHLNNSLFLYFADRASLCSVCVSESERVLCVSSSIQLLNSFAVVWLSASVVLISLSLSTSASLMCGAQGLPASNKAPVWERPLKHYSHTSLWALYTMSSSQSHTRTLMLPANIWSQHISVLHYNPEIIMVGYWCMGDATYVNANKWNNRNLNFLRLYLKQTPLPPAVTYMMCIQ